MPPRAPPVRREERARERREDKTDLDEAERPPIAMKTKHTSGFTLIELLVAIVVGSIVLTVGVSGFRSIIAQQRVAAAANDILGALSAARAEALRLHQAVILCPSSNGTTCNGSTTNWNIGWIAARTSSASVTGWAAPTPTAVVRAHPRFSGVNIYSEINGAFTGFDGYGYPLVPGSFVITDAGGGDTRTVCLLMSGVFYERSGTNYCN